MTGVTFRNSCTPVECSNYSHGLAYDDPRSFTRFICDTRPHRASITSVNHMRKPNEELALRLNRMKTGVTLLKFARSY